MQTENTPRTAESRAGRGRFRRKLSKNRKARCEYSCRMRNPEREGLKDLKRLEMA